MSDLLLLAAHAVPDVFAEVFRVHPWQAIGACSDLWMIEMLEAEIADLEQQLRIHMDAIPAAGRERRRDYRL